MLLRPYCTIDDVRRHIGNTSAADEDLEVAINRASRYIEDKTGRNFWFNDYSEAAYTVRRIDVIGDMALLPFEVITLTEVSQDDAVLTEGTEGDYSFEVGERVIKSNSSWSTAIPYTGTLTVKGTFGFELDETDPDEAPPQGLPEPINTACILVAATYSGVWMKSITGLGGERESVLVQRIPTEVAGLLKPFSVKLTRAAF